AQTMADDLDLELNVEEVASSEVEEGKIVSQDPEYKEEKIDAGSTITVRVSKGPETAELPKLEGLTIEEAREKAEELGITLIEETENSDTVQQGYIIDKIQK